MKRDFLKNLGIEDKEIVDKILDENSADIGRAKGELDGLKEQITTLTAEKQTLTNELTNLKNSTSNYEDLKNQVATLKTEKSNLEAELNGRVTQIQKDHAIENAVREAKAKNVKSVVALLDTSKITYENDQLSGISEQLEALTTGEDTAFLFGDTKPTPPSGTDPHTPPANGGNNGGGVGNGKSFADIVKNALTTNNNSTK